MVNSFTDSKVSKLISYINQLHIQFSDITPCVIYTHMGATIVDSILQSGLNYTYTVYPRVRKLLYQYNDYKTTCDFLILMQVEPLEQLINWKHEIKLTRINELTNFLYDNNIENEQALGLWLQDSVNTVKLSNIKGIGPKTIDYLNILVGNESIAIDRHLFTFLENADIIVNSYDEAKQIFFEVALSLGINKISLDKGIWNYMNIKSDKFYERTLFA